MAEEEAPKSIVVSLESWQGLMALKAELNVASMDDVIVHLLKLAKKKGKETS